MTFTPENGRLTVRCDCLCHKFEAIDDITVSHAAACCLRDDPSDPPADDLKAIIVRAERAETLLAHERTVNGYLRDALRATGVPAHFIDGIAAPRDPLAALVVEQINE